MLLNVRFSKVVLGKKSKQICERAFCKDSERRGEQYASQVNLVFMREIAKA